MQNLSLRCNDVIGELSHIFAFNAFSSIWSKTPYNIFLNVQVYAGSLPHSVGLGCGKETQGWIVIWPKCDPLPLLILKLCNMNISHVLFFLHFCLLLVLGSGRFPFSQRWTCLTYSNYINPSVQSEKGNHYNAPHHFNMSSLGVCNKK